MKADIKADALARAFKYHRSRRIFHPANMLLDDLYRSAKPLQGLPSKGTHYTGSEYVHFQSEFKVWRIGSENGFVVEVYEHEEPRSNHHLRRSSFNVWIKGFDDGQIQAVIGTSPGEKRKTTIKGVSTDIFDMVSKQITEYAGNRLDRDRLGEPEGADADEAYKNLTQRIQMEAFTQGLFYGRRGTEELHAFGNRLRIDEDEYTLTVHASDRSNRFTISFDGVEVKTSQ